MLTTQPYILYQKSPTSLHKSPVFLLHWINGGGSGMNTPGSNCMWPKETCYQKRPTFSTQRARYLCKRALSCCYTGSLAQLYRKHPCEQVSAIKRDPSKETYLWSKEPYISIRELTPVWAVVCYQKRPFFNQKSPIYPQESSHPIKRDWSADEKSPVIYPQESSHTHIYIHKRAHRGVHDRIAADDPV